MEKVENIRILLDEIQKECDFKTVDDYNRFIEIGIQILEEVKN